MHQPQLGSDKKHRCPVESSVNSCCKIFLADSLQLMQGTLYWLTRCAFGTLLIWLTNVWWIYSLWCGPRIFNDIIKVFVGNCSCQCVNIQLHALYSTWVFPVHCMRVCSVCLGARFHVSEAEQMRLHLQHWISRDAGRSISPVRAPAVKQRPGCRYSMIDWQSASILTQTSRLNCY